MITETRYTKLAESVIAMINKSLNEESMFSIDSNWGNVMPKISKSDLKLKYGTRFDISALLFLTEDFTAVLDYWFALSSIENGIYSSAIFFSQNLDKKVKGYFNKRKLKKVVKSNLLEWISLFVILHEVGHGIYTRYPEMREHAFFEIDKGLDELAEMQKRCNPQIIPQLKDIKKKNKSLKKIEVPSESLISANSVDLIWKDLPDLDRKSVKEELACDLYSLSLAIQFINHGDDSENTYLDFYKASMAALVLITRYNFVIRRFVKMQDNERYAMNKDAQTLRLMNFYHECTMGLLSRGFKTTKLYDFVKQFPIDWMVETKSYTEKYDSFIIDSSRGENPNGTDKESAISYLEKIESFIVEKFLS